MGAATRIGFAVLFFAAAAWMLVAVLPDVLTVKVAYWMGFVGCVTVGIGFVVDWINSPASPPSSTR